MKLPKGWNSHKFNYCVNCPEVYDKGYGFCPRCGSPRRRAYRKNGEFDGDKHTLY